VLPTACRILFPLEPNSLAIITTAWSLCFLAERPVLNATEPSSSFLTPCRVAGHQLSTCHTPNNAWSLMSHLLSQTRMVLCGSLVDTIAHLASFVKSGSGGSTLLSVKVGPNATCPAAGKAPPRYMAPVPEEEGPAALGQAGIPDAAPFPGKSRFRCPGCGKVFTELARCMGQVPPVSVSVGNTLDGHLDKG